MHLVTSVKSTGTKDKTYALFPVALWTYVASISVTAFCHCSPCYSVAEITSGIVCGCLVTMPNFFRHFISKITSKLHSSRKSGSSNKTPYFAPSNSKKIVDKWSDNYDPASRNDQYLELNEGNTWRSPAKVASGGFRSNPVRTGPWENQKPHVLDGADVESGILKTTHIQQYPQKL